MTVNVATQLPLEDRLLQQMEDALKSRKKADEDYETALRILKEVLAGKARQLVKPESKGIQFSANGKRVYGYVLRHWPCTSENPIGFMLVFEGMQRFWLIVRIQEPGNPLPTEITSSASVHAIDSIESATFIRGILDDEAISP
jgi:hypothetical protein